MPLGDYQVNCYFVWEDGADTCAVIDPGYEPKLVMEQATRLGKTIEAILLTHGHFDHVGAVEDIVKAAECKLWMNEADWSQFPNPVTSYFYPLANCDFTEVNFCEDAEVIHAGGLRFVTLATPGHTHGSVCFRCENALFTGDTLFAGSCGRTDLPGGDPRKMMESLNFRL